MKFKDFFTDIVLSGEIDKIQNKSFKTNFLSESLTRNFSKHLVFIFYNPDTFSVVGKANSV